MRYELYKDPSGQFRWRLVAENGKTIANGGEGYHNQTDCEHAVSLVMDTDHTTPLVWAS